MPDAASSSPSRMPAARATPRGFQLLSPAFLDELRARVTLSGVVSRWVPLKRAGNEWKACCPFHAEKTPSFWVNDAKGFYHCFGCGAHGDAIRFLTETQGLAFMDAVKELADKAGLELPKPDPAAARRQERALGLGDIVEQAVVQFRAWFEGAEGAEARAYAARRGLSAETLEAFRVGYAPEGRDCTAKALPEAEPAMLIEAGLLIEVEGKAPYDRFRGRLMVPIRDARGRAIAFGGRVIGEGEPKYLNSPETPLFDKGRTLFNLDRAAPAARRTGRLFVVEGYLDAISLDQAGIRETVAPLGTALTEAQLELLWRQVDEPTLCFDGDMAGRKAAARAAERALAQLRPGKHLRIALLPTGSDPDDLVREGGAAGFEAVAARAQPLAEFLYAVEREQIDRDRPEQRAALRARLDEMAAACADRLVADEFRRSFRELFFEDFGWKRTDLKRIAGAASATHERPRDDPLWSHQRALLLGLSRRPSVVRRRLEEIAALSFADRRLTRWRDVLIDAVARQPDLDSDAIESILAIAAMPELLRFDTWKDLRFRALRRNTAEAEAVAQLDGLIEMLGQEREFADEIDGLDRALSADGAEDGYELLMPKMAQARAGLDDLRQRRAGWNGDEAE